MLPPESRAGECAAAAARRSLGAHHTTTCTYHVRTVVGSESFVCRAVDTSLRSVRQAGCHESVNIAKQIQTTGMLGDNDDCLSRFHYCTYVGVGFPCLLALQLSDTCVPMPDFLGPGTRRHWAEGG